VPAPANNALTRFAQYEQLKRTLEAAKQYDQELKKREDEQAKKQGGDKKGTTKSARISRDAGKDHLRPVVKGTTPLRLEAHREDDIRNALRLADELKLRMVLDGVSNPRSAADLIASRHIPVVLGPFADFEDTSREERSSDWPKTLLANDNHWALGTFSTQPRGSRLLRVHAAAAVALGIDAGRVLRAMTADAADILGVADRLGTIAPGKQADLAVFAGDPLDPSVPVRLTISEGKIIYQAEVKARSDSAPAAMPTASNLPARLPKKYALKTQRLVDQDGKSQPGMLLIDSGKVVALGPNVSVDAGTPTYDLGAAVLTPGLVAGQSTLGLAASFDDPAEANAGQIRAADVLEPSHRSARDLLEGGFTAALYTPGSLNVIAGVGCGIRLGASQPMLGDAGMKFVLTATARGAARTAPASDDALPSFIGRGRSGPPRYPGSLAGQVELIERVLSDKAPATELYLPAAVRQQIQAERKKQIAALLERKQVAYFEANTRAEVGAALQLIDRFKLRGVLIGPEEIKPFLPEIKRLGVSIVARPVHTGDYDRPLLELAEVASAGVPVVFGSASPQEMRITAALAVNAGMSREAAWRGLTTSAGLPDNAGKLAVGSPADFVVWDGSPLDVRSRPLRVVVDGKAVQALP
jgi:imidazolonepropionase-like amidohydrolase